MHLDNDLLSLFKRHLHVVYIPQLFPMNSNIPVVSHDWTKENEFLLLQWICHSPSLP